MSEDFSSKLFPCQESYIILIDQLLSKGWASFTDMNVALNENIQGIPRVKYEGRPKEEYLDELMFQNGLFRSNINQAINHMVDAWALVRRGVDIEGILEKDKLEKEKVGRKRPANPIRSEFRDLFIDSKKIEPSDSNESLLPYNLSEATLYRLRNDTEGQGLYIFKYIEDGFSILKDVEAYDNESKTEAKKQRSLASLVNYDIKDADRYSFIPAPDVIARKRKLLIIRALQDELLRDTTGAVQKRLKEIEQLKKNKPAGWLGVTSEKYLNAIYDGRDVFKDLDLGPIIHQYGSHLMEQKDYSQSHSFLKESLDTLREEMLFGNNQAKEEYAQILQNLSALHSFTGNFQLSEEEAIESLGIFRGLSTVNENYSYGVATLLYSLAGIHVKMRKYDTVEEEYDEAASIFSRLSDEKPTLYLYWWVECITSLAGYYYFVRKISDSIEAYERAMPFLDKLTEKNFDDFAPQKVKAMINYSLALQDSGAVEKAEDILHESIHLIHVLNERSPNVYNEELSTALQDLGSLYGETGDPNRAREVLLTAEGLRRELASADPNAYNSRLATTLDSLANLDLLEGENKEAISKWQEALSLLEVYDDDGSNTFFSDKGRYCFCIGLTFLNLGDKDNALTFLSMAESLFRTIFDRNSAPQMFEDKYAMALSYLGVIYESKEEKEAEAEKKYEESLDIALWFNSCANTLDRSFLIIVYCNYAPFLFNRGRYEEAKQMWEQAVKFGDAEEGPSMISSQSQGLLDLAKQNILEAEYRIENPDYDESDEEELSDENDTPAFPPEVAIEAVKSIAGQIDAMDKYDVDYREKCIDLYRNSLQYCSSIPESFFLADYLSTLCKFISDSYLFEPIVDIAPVALRIYEKALQEDDSNMQIRLKYIESLSIYCRSLNEYNHHDELSKAIKSAFEILKPIVINRQDDVACTYAALKGEVMLDFITDTSSEDAYSISTDALNYYRDVSQPSRYIMCRLLSKAAIIACDNEKFYEAEELISEAEELMRDCDLRDMRLRLCLGQLFILKGRYIDMTPQKWPNNYANYSVDKSLEAFSFAQQVLEGGVIYNPAAFKCALLDLYRFKLICMGVRLPIDTTEESDFSQLYYEQMDIGCGSLMLDLYTHDVSDTCQRMLKLIRELTDLNEYVFSWRSVEAYLEIVEAYQEVSFSDFFNNNITKNEFKNRYNKSLSMYSHMESMLNGYKKTATSLYTNYLSRISGCKKRLKKNYRKALNGE